MTITTKTYTRKPFTVDAIQVTDENMAEIAEWCSGEVQSITKTNGTRPYVKVNVHRATNLRKTQAFSGDWVLRSGQGFKVYTPRAFDVAFEPQSEATRIANAHVPPIQLTQVKP